MVKNCLQAYFCVVILVNRVLTVESSSDRVNKNRSSLLETELSVNSCHSCSIGCVEIDVNHSSHVYVQLLGQKVLEAGENL